MTRPIGPYQHPRPAWLHKGHYRRIETYLRGGLNLVQVARLVGIDPSSVRYFREREGWRPETTSAHGRG